VKASTSPLRLPSDNSKKRDAAETVPPIGRRPGSVKK
jgi:hypothetical protein